MVTGSFLALLQGVFPLVFPLQVKKVSDGSTARHFFNELFHVVGAALFHLLGHMSIDIQRKRRCRMSKVPLHRLDIVTGMDCGNCVAVAKIMEASLGHTDRCDNALVAVIHIVRRNMTAQLVRKDKAAVFPCAARTDPFCALLRLMLFQQ